MMKKERERDRKERGKRRRGSSRDHDGAKAKVDPCRTVQHDVAHHDDGRTNVY